MSVDSAVSWKNLTGYLWLCCYSCAKYISTKNGDNERLKEPAVLWKRLGLKDILEPPEKWPVTAARSVHWYRFEARDCALSNLPEGNKLVDCLVLETNCQLSDNF